MYIRKLCLSLIKRYSFNSLDNSGKWFKFVKYNIISYNRKILIISILELNKLALPK